MAVVNTNVTGTISQTLHHLEQLFGCLWTAWWIAIPTNFAIKNSLPWLTNETKHILIVWDLEQSFGSKDATACATVCQKAKDAIPQSVLDTITRFQKEGWQNSATFAYWDSFLQSGNILLRLLRADREANFLMHIQAVTETVPYFILAGRIKYRYSRYTLVYIAEMKQLEEREPLMYRHMMERGLLFVGQRVGFSIVSLQIKPWNKQPIVKQRARGCYRLHTAQRRTATLANDTSHHGRICGGFQRTL